MDAYWPGVDQFAGDSNGVSNANAEPDVELANQRDADQGDVSNAPSSSTAG